MAAERWAHTDPTERGLWPTGYTKLAAPTMATLFWGWLHVCTQTEGQEQCWKEDIHSGISAGHIFGYVRQARGSGLCFGFSVIGFEVMNEPQRAYMDLASLHSFNYNVRDATDIIDGKEVNWGSVVQCCLQLERRKLPDPCQRVSRFHPHSIHQQNRRFAWV
ncbi:hypothetical protein F5887DRAFT_132386 [Amanita rubescens]|nr:hypothetical protein F5887DRAFT_132386 [Amanita rubescens]